MTNGQNFQTATKPEIPFRARSAVVQSDWGMCKDSGVLAGA